MAGGLKPTRWNERFWASTRGRIIQLLRRSGRTVNELAGVLGLSDNTVRSHLTTLERDGFVQASGTRPGTRKPNITYDLTPETEQLFPRVYGRLLHHLLDALKPRMSGADLEQVLRQGSATGWPTNAAPPWRSTVSASAPRAGGHRPGDARRLRGAGTRRREIRHPLVRLSAGRGGGRSPRGLFARRDAPGQGHRCGRPPTLSTEASTPLHLRGPDRRFCDPQPHGQVPCEVELRVAEGIALSPRRPAGIFGRMLHSMLHHLACDPEL